jgi:hypothetical protein
MSLTKKIKIINTWSSEEDLQLLEEVENKKDYDWIALKHKRVIADIISRVISHIIYPKYKDTIYDDIKNISEKYNIKSNLIIRYVNKLNDITPPLDIKNIKNEKELLDYYKLLDIKIEKLRNILNELNNIIIIILFFLLLSNTDYHHIFYQL